MRKETKLIHGGIFGDEKTGAVSTPIYQTSTFKQDAVGKDRGYEYSRTGNPTRESLEKLINDLEGGKGGFAFASGMAAISTVLMLFNAGDEVIVSNNVYGGTFRVLEKVFKRLGIVSKFVDTSLKDNVVNSITKNTKAIFYETPTNPLMTITNIREISRIAKEYSILSIVDNTFMTPYFQRPIELGADIVVHSATKYLGGHSDVVAGLVVVNSEELAHKIHFLQNAVGGILGPQDSYLVIRGIKTLSVRMERHEKNAKEIANWLLEQPEVEKVYYPGLHTHPGYDIAKEQMDGFGGVISFELKNKDMALKLLNNVKLITLAESLGGYESLISYPAKMTHASIPEEQRLKLGITDKLVRLSVGLENYLDLIEDLKNAIRS
ncbi:bifunctional cystathionine gamma-lyase/homocysteine desulfhydrase [Thermoanaerobacterium butyriciformans]|uniref:Cystathionine beta-lyase/cystathionine gamma-synthase n=1 Tax=Thermoanaerobacterium butyriciformans TaxID=1702242 RepID=A0ABS4NJ75_9THEO|nr:bifunctional cystathionine gamma-lyase/homocysteine desulfhydrase [Thermoanaerobacterium butyriciformans]MBP2073132.1 cystathionine beta-lyase/cystathionine gamma-synthase [Thermoanaerobacterium butyriciformans]HHV75049.1 bifunctional cystathionine gamma-lyase/homocysteine desulfhydrase [Thermoanaerobacterium sp.]